MTKEQFLEGREFKISEDSFFTFKRGVTGAIIRKYDDFDDWNFHALVYEINEDNFIVMTSMLDSNYYSEKIMFNDLILV